MVVWSPYHQRTQYVRCVGALGMRGAFTECGEWFQYRWPAEWESVHITVRELLPIVVSVAVWGHSWRGCTVRCRCDNAAVVAIIRSGSSRDPTAMHLMRCLFFITARYQIVLVPAHIPGKRNEADSSHRTCRSGESRYLRFCQLYDCFPLPVSKDNLCKFVTYLGGVGLKHRTIKTYLSGVRFLQIRSGYPDFFRGTHAHRAWTTR